MPNAWTSLQSKEVEGKKDEKGNTKNSKKKKY